MDSLDRFIAEQSVELTLEIRTELIRTQDRIDTGWSRANWQLTIGSPPSAPVGQEGTATGFSDMAAVKAIVGYVSPDQPLFVSNRVRYVGLATPGRGALSVDEVAAAVQRAVQARMAQTLEAAA
jgi:hypothetical protein